MCLRANVARSLLGLAHREFCARLADSPLLQWFLHVGEVDSVKVFAKSTSHRFENWVKPESLRRINAKLSALSCAPAVVGSPSAAFDLQTPVVCDDAFFDTTVVKAPIHFPTDCVQRLKDSGLPVSKLRADRGMFSAANEALPAVNGMNSGLTPARSARTRPAAARPRGEGRDETAWRHRSTRGHL